MSQNIKVGDGVKIEWNEPSQTIVQDSPNEYCDIEIKQTITLSAIVRVPNPNYINHGISGICEICNCRAPLPDSVAAKFILQNSDGFRICFPDVESCPKDRDRYPVKGWTRREVGEKPIIVCGQCKVKLDNATAEAITQIKSSQKPCGNPQCGCSTTIADEISFGSGELDGYGFWEHPCRPCAEEEGKLTGKRAWPHA